MSFGNVRRFWKVSFPLRQPKAYPEIGKFAKDRQFLKTVDFPLSESKITFFFLDVPAERESYLGNMLD